MFRNYFKVAYRNILKNPLSSFINVLGLSAGVACCVIAYTYMSLELGMEDQHRNKDRIFMVTNLVDRDGEPEWYGVSPAPIGLKLKEDFPQITHLSRVEDRNVVVQKEQIRFHQWIRMVEPDYLDMFDFEILKGNRSALDDPSGVVINEKIAKKYFGDDDPMGQRINLRFNGNHKVALTVTALAAVDETKSSFVFDFLVNFDLLDQVDDEFKATDWSENISSTLFMINDPASIAMIEANNKSYTALCNGAQPEWEILDFNYEPIATIYDRSTEIRWDISQQADVEGRYIISIIALLMLLLACLNYLNIAITSAVKRLKEIGIRKVIGANRTRLVAQFMIENILLSCIALIFGLIIGVFFFLPGLNNLFGIEMGFEVLSLSFYLFVTGLLVLTAILSGAYPAIYISKFQVISIFKGNTTFGRKNILSKIFLTLEFIIASIAVTCGVLFTLNNNYQLAHEWGYDQDNLVVLEFNSHDDLERMRNEVESIRNVEGITSGLHHLGSSLYSSVIQFPDQKLEVRQLDVDEDYVHTVGLELATGELLEEFDHNAVLINETFARQLNWERPIGETFRFDSTQYTVKGVLKDFHYFSFWNEIQPVFVRIARQEDLRYLVVRTDSEETIALYEQLETTWATLFPEEPFDGDYQTQLYFDYFQSVNGHRVLMVSVSIMAIIMTSLGLYGLIGLNISGRKKEFSIRKVLGASNLALSRSIGSHFMLFLLIALALGFPLSYLIVKALFDMIYNYHMGVSVMPVMGSLMLIVLTIIATIYSHLVYVAKQNPTEGLRAE